MSTTLHLDREYPHPRALSDTPKGSRLQVEQTGFEGLRAWIVSRILALGSRKLYGVRLPQLLAELATGAAPSNRGRR